jgi:hypothetical protein
LRFRVYPKSIGVETHFILPSREPARRAGSRDGRMNKAAASKKACCASFFTGGGQMF